MNSNKQKFTVSDVTDVEIVDQSNLDAASGFFDIEITVVVVLGPHALNYQPRTTGDVNAVSTKLEPWADATGFSLLKAECGSDESFNELVEELRVENSDTGFINLDDFGVTVMVALAGHTIEMGFIPFKNPDYHDRSATALFLVAASSKTLLLDFLDEQGKENIKKIIIDQVLESGVQKEFSEYVWGKYDHDSADPFLLKLKKTPKQEKQ